MYRDHGVSQSRATRQYGDWWCFFASIDEFFFVQKGNENRNYLCELKFPDKMTAHQPSWISVKMQYFGKYHT